MSDGIKIAVLFVAACMVAFGVDHMTAVNPISLSLVDEECRGAQQQYYDARERASRVKEKISAEVDKRSNSEHDHADVCAQHRMAKAAEWGLGALYLTLFFSGFAAIMAYRTVTTMDQTARKQLRAYVSVQPNFINVLGPNSRQVAISFAILNHGTTPARDVNHASIVDICPFPLPDQFPFPEMPDRSGRFVLHPTQIFQGTRTTDQNGFTNEAITAAAASQNQRFYIFGELSYVDVFAVTQRTRFCWSVVGGENLARVMGLRGEIPDNVQINYEPADQHNEAT